MKIVSTIMLMFLTFNAYPQVVLTDNSQNAIGIFLERLSSFNNPGQVDPGGIYEDDRYDYHLLTPEGFRFIVYYKPSEDKAYLSGYWRGSSSSAQNIIVFESNDCTGQAYMEGSFGGVISTPRNDNNFENNGITPDIWYSPKGSEPTLIEPSSRYDHGKIGNVCIQVSSLEKYGIPVIPNDPDVTGLTISEWNTPIDFSTSLSPGVMGCLFRDGFECLN